MVSTVPNGVNRTGMGWSNSPSDRLGLHYAPMNVSGLASHESTFQLSTVETEATKPRSETPISWVMDGPWVFLIGAAGVASHPWSDHDSLRCVIIYGTRNRVSCRAKLLPAAIMQNCNSPNARIYLLRHILATLTWARNELEDHSIEGRVGSMRFQTIQLLSERYHISCAQLITHACRYFF